jgi:hypothetical protein
MQLMKQEIEQALAKSYTYDGYKQLITNLLSDGKSTGHIQSEDLTHYSQLNETRMKRLDKTIVITESVAAQLKSIKQNYLFLVISEGWCGDAAQILPVINKMVNLAPTIDLKIVLRDDNEPLMNLFLTNNAKSIPILICINSDTNEVVNSWGPRPKPAVELVENYKKEHRVIDATLKTNLQKWYHDDKGLATQSEILQIMLR